MTVSNEDWSDVQARIAREKKDNSNRLAKIEQNYKSINDFLKSLGFPEMETVPSFTFSVNGNQDTYTQGKKITAIEGSVNYKLIHCFSMLSDFLNPKSTSVSLLWARTHVCAHINDQNDIENTRHEQVLKLRLHIAKALLAQPKDLSFSKMINDFISKESKQDKYAVLCLLSGDSYALLKEAERKAYGKDSNHIINSQATLAKEIASDLQLPLDTTVDKVLQVCMSSQSKGYN